MRENQQVRLTADVFSRATAVHTRLLVAIEESDMHTNAD
jgi:hypothetical protein